jgi:pimeloyl-ACP methyl ester carboxylesterase
LLDERRTLTEARTLLRHPIWHGRGVPSGDGMPVLLVPGFLAGDIALNVMSRWLGRLGYPPYRSTVQLSVDCSRASVDRLARRLDLITQREGRLAAILGQSVGGLLAKAVAIRRPDLVAGIVTLGSPHTARGATHRLLHADLRLASALRRAGVRHLASGNCECADDLWQVLRQPFPATVPFTSVYSRTDRVVDWRACLDPAAEPVEVASSHVGMAINPWVYRIVADRLAGLGSATTATAG